MFGPGKLLMLAGGACWRAVTPAFASAFLWQTATRTRICVAYGVQRQHALAIGEVLRCLRSTTQAYLRRIRSRTFHICVVRPIHVVIPWWWLVTLVLIVRHGYGDSFRDSSRDSCRDTNVTRPGLLFVILHEFQDLDDMTAERIEECSRVRMALWCKVKSASPPVHSRSCVYRSRYHDESVIDSRRERLGTHRIYIDLLFFSLRMRWCSIKIIWFVRRRLHRPLCC